MNELACIEDQKKYIIRDWKGSNKGRDIQY